jgi:hypothetical protein
MALFTGMTSWVFSCSLMLWAPRVTVIELHREQCVFGEGSGELEGTQLRRYEEQATAW